MIQYKLVKHSEYLEPLLALFQQAFGFSMPQEYWRWKYLLNPASSPASELIVAEDTDVLVGARPFFMAGFMWGNQKLTAAEHSDTMVHPQYRNQGIFSRMGQLSAEHIKAAGVDLSFGFPGAMSRPGFMRQGYRKVTAVDNMLKVIDAPSLIARRLNYRLMGVALRRGYDRKSPARLPPVETPFAVETLDVYHQALDGLDTLRQRAVIDLERSAAYLRWRFDSHPLRKYKYVLAKLDGVLWGCAVINLPQQSDKDRSGILVDYAIKDGDAACLRAVLRRCLWEFNLAGCDNVRSWAFSQPHLQRELSGRFGFKSALKFPYNKILDQGYMDALLVNEQLADKLDIYNPRNWKLTRAFADFS